MRKLFFAQAAALTVIMAGPAVAADMPLEPGREQGRVARPESAVERPGVGVEGCRQPSGQVRLVEVAAGDPESVRHRSQTAVARRSVSKCWFS